MRNHAPIFWHEGIFLRPHHLQQQDPREPARELGDVRQLGVDVRRLQRMEHAVNEFLDKVS